MFVLKVTPGLSLEDRAALQTLQQCVSVCVCVCLCVYMCVHVQFPVPLTVAVLFTGRIAEAACPQPVLPSAVAGMCVCACVCVCGQARGQGNYHRTLHLASTQLLGSTEQLTAAQSNDTKQVCVCVCAWPKKVKTSSPGETRVHVR